MKTKDAVVAIVLLMLIPLTLNAQWNLNGLGGGVGIGGAVGHTDAVNNQLDYQGRAFFRYGFVDHLQLDAGIGETQIKGDQYNTHLTPFDLRLLISPLSDDSWNPYLYGGIGILHYDVQKYPMVPTPGAPPNGWKGVVPFGVGVQIPFVEHVMFEVSGGYNYTFSDDLDALRVDGKDGFWGFLIGLTATGGESALADADNDGLTNKEERELGTDPHNPDTDGDGLSDGDEVHKYHTDPLKVDTDGDGLTDGDEVLKYHTDPLNKDSDGDGLTDGDEILKYHTDPLNKDTDGDGLSDGDEVMKYHTDPLKKDTDGGTVDDGTEVARGTNPLDPKDDVPVKPEEKKEELKTEVGKAIVLEGIVFKTGSAEITPQSEDILVKAYNTLNDNPEIEVQINGYTDNVGKRSANMKLSQERADAVKQFLVGKGIAASRMVTQGFGPDKPIASNKTADGKQKNRRIEFLRTK